jgi:hypothetical protein
LPPETRLLFHESEVRRIAADARAGTLEIHFPAARVRESGALGDDDACLGRVILDTERPPLTPPGSRSSPRFVARAEFGVGSTT